MSESKKRPLPDDLLNGGPRVEQLWFEVDTEKVFYDYASRMMLWRRDAEIVKMDWWIDNVKGKTVYRLCIDGQPYFHGDEPESITPRTDAVSQTSWEAFNKEDGAPWQSKYERRLQLMTEHARTLERQLRSLLPE